MKKSYTLEFKKQAVELAESLGSVLEAARQLGISDGAIHVWRKKLSKEPKNIKSTELNSADLDELKRLRKENAEQKKVIQILKMASAFFSQDQLK